MKYVTKLVFTVFLMVFSPLSLSQTGQGQKIVILDSGIYSNAIFKQSRVIDELCWSIDDEATLDSGPAPRYNDLLKGSVCKNGTQKDFTSSNAATLPRLARHSSTSAEYATHTFGNNHGTLVYNEAITAAFDARYIIIANSYYDADRKITFKGNDGVACGVHGPNGNLNEDGTVKPSDNVGCYGVGDALEQREVINKIVAYSNVSALNYSAGIFSNRIFARGCTRNDAIFRDLKEDHNIAVVVAAGNSGVSAPIRYPACSNYVVTVGALEPNGSIADYTSRGFGNSHLDFFADGLALINGLTLSQQPRGTSYAAPIVSAAFAAIQSAESTVRTVDEIKYALEFAATNFITVDGRQVPVVKKASVTAAIACLQNNTCIKNENPSTDELGVSDGGSYGPSIGDNSPNYQIEIELVPPPALPDFQQNQVVNSQALSAQKTTIDFSGKRDVTMKFEAVMASNVSNAMDIIVNGILVHRTSMFRNISNIEFTISKRYFVVGNNTIILQPRYSNRLWGVRNIEAEYTPIVPLLFNQTDRTRYGSNEPPVRRPTGLRASFELSDLKSNVKLEALGLAVNYNEEIEVYLNGRFQGTMVKSRSGIPDTFTFSRSSLIEGTNVIEFYQADNVSLPHRQWGVTNILIKKFKVSAVTPIMILLLDE